MIPTKTLTPAQRALLQFCESMIITALVAGLLSIQPYIVGNEPLNWRQIGAAFALAFIISLAHSAAAYFKAANGVDLGTLVDAVIQEMEKRSIKSTLSSVNAPEVPVVVAKDKQ